MLKIGITGTIASGKSEVCNAIKKRGFAVFNSDNYAKMATHKGNPCYEALLEVLGEDVLDSNGDIDKQKMAEHIFQNEEKRQKVNAIVHPYVIQGMESFFLKQNEKPFVFAEIPLLFEAGIESMFDRVLVVTCKKETAIQRMMQDRNYSRKEAEDRYTSQIDSEIQKQKATDVIYNDEDMKALNASVNAWIKELRKGTR